MPDKIETALRLLNEAIKLLEDAGGSRRTRRPEWFDDAGHLSEQGIAHLHSLFASGKSSYAAAKEMGITHRSAALRRGRASAKEDSEENFERKRRFIRLA